MKLLVLNESPRKNATVATLLKCVTEGLPPRECGRMDWRMQTEHQELHGVHGLPGEKTCVLPEDDAHVVGRKIAEADALLIGSPVHWGDKQRIHSTQAQYGAITFKHILLPVWLNGYRFRDRVSRILINASTGEVQGERTFGGRKITAANRLGARPSSFWMVDLQKRENGRRGSWSRRDRIYATSGAIWRGFPNSARRRILQKHARAERWIYLDSSMPLIIQHAVTLLIIQPRSLLALPPLPQNGIGPKMGTLAMSLIFRIRIRRGL